MFVLRALDRDFPYGQADYSFTVFAEDALTREKLGSANVYVTLKGKTMNTQIFIARAKWRGPRLQSIR